MRLRDQALTALLAAACCASCGCARLLSAIVAPQEAAMSAANQVAARVTAPARSELSRMDGEVTRLLQGDGANREELRRVQGELRRRLPSERDRDGAAQDDPARLRPWHPRAPEPRRALGLRDPGDELALGRAVGERGMPAPGPPPDGVPAAQLRTPIDLSRIRVEPRR